MTTEPERGVIRQIGLTDTDYTPTFVDPSTMRNVPIIILDGPSELAPDAQHL